MALPQNEMFDWYMGYHQCVHSVPELADLRQLYPVRPDWRPRLTDFMKIHATASLWMVSQLNKSVEQQIIRGFDTFVRQQLKVPTLDLADEAAAAADSVERLSVDGYAPLPVIDSVRIDAMRAYLESHPVAPDPREPDTLVPLERARDGNLAHYLQDTVIACPHVLELATDTRLISLVEQTLGTVPTLINISSWWSFAGRDEARDAQLFHLDVDDYRFCKVFIYLTDVDEDSGPHVFVPGTHDPEVIRQTRDSHPDGPEAFEQWFFKALRKTDDEVRHFLGRDPLQLTGLAGTRFIVQTRGVHKGLLPKRRDRLLLQFEYGVTPALQQVPEQIVLGSDRAEHVPATVADGASKSYVTRLFVRGA